MGHFPYDAVVFDLDGTLFDAEEGIVSSVVKAMKEMGLEIPQGAQLQQVVGPPLRYSFHDLLNVPSERLDEAADRYAHIFRSEGMYRYSVYPGIRTMLRVLKENGIYVALASSKPRDLCERILRHYGLRHFFDRVIGETDSHAKLGKPEMIRRALPERYWRAAMVGDRLYTDVATGVNFGMTRILVMSGETTEAMLAASDIRPTAVFGRLSDMIPYL